MVLVGLKNPIIGDNRVFLFFTNLQKSICYKPPLFVQHSIESL